MSDSPHASDDVVEVAETFATVARTLAECHDASTVPDAFDESDVALGSVFAVHASAAMSAARRDESLEQKAESRDVIGRVKGIVAARSGVSDEEAFAMLRRASQRMNVKLRDIATQVADQAPPPQPSQP